MSAFDKWAATLGIVAICTGLVVASHWWLRDPFFEGVVLGVCAVKFDDIIRRIWRSP